MQRATRSSRRVSGIEQPGGRPFARVDVERYTFRNGKLAEKDVYSRIEGERATRA